MNNETIIERKPIDFKDCKNKFNICDKAVRLMYFLHKATEYNACNPLIRKYKIKTDDGEGIHYNLIYSINNPKVFKNPNFDGTIESHTINLKTKIEINYYKIKDKRWETIYVSNASQESCIKFDGDDKDSNDIYNCTENLFKQKDYTEEGFIRAVKNIFDDDNY